MNTTTIKHIHATNYAKEFKNGNISIHYDADTIEQAKSDEILTISSILDGIDCYFVGDTFCLNNYETGHLVYNTYSDLVYIFAWSLLEDLKQGKTIKLYARKPDEDDREVINTSLSE